VIAQSYGHHPHHYCDIPAVLLIQYYDNRAEFGYDFPEATLLVVQG
jgi:hypothetical protein